MLLCHCHTYDDHDQMLLFFKITAAQYNACFYTDVAVHSQPFKSFCSKLRALQACSSCSCTGYIRPHDLGADPAAGQHSCCSYHASKGHIGLRISICKSAAPAGSVTSLVTCAVRYHSMLRAWSATAQTAALLHWSCRTS